MCDGMINGVLKVCELVYRLNLCDLTKLQKKEGISASNSRLLDMPYAASGNDQVVSIFSFWFNLL